MAKANDFGCGLTHELAIAAAKVGWEPKDMSLLAENSELLSSILGIFKGAYEIKPKNYKIQPSSVSFNVPGNWEVVINPSMPDILWNVEYEPRLANIKSIDFGHSLRFYGAMNAHICEFLLKQPFLIPKSWKEKDGHKNYPTIVFPGTIFCKKGKKENETEWLVRTLQFNGFEWRPGCEYLHILKSKSNDNYYIPFIDFV